ncbi:FKBP8 (predicted), partial [Pycnogonum litorale]
VLSADTSEPFVHRNLSVVLSLVESEEIMEKSDSPEEIDQAVVKTESNTDNVSQENDWLDVLGNGELKKKVIRNGEGTGTRPDRGKTLTVNIKVSLTDGTLIEELNDEKVILGDSDVIQGVDLVLALMERGEISEAHVPSRLAYGKSGRLPEIPANSDLVYVIELVNAEDTPDEDSLSFDDRMQFGEQKKNKGNFWYSISQFTQAIHCYRRSLDYFDSETNSLSGPDDELQQLLECRVKVYNNMAAAQLKINAHEAAAKSLDFVLKAQPDNVKGLFRTGKVYASLGRVDEAIKYMKTAIKLEPESKVIHQE